MTGRRWFITGISSGIGKALAQAALAAGDHVTGTARDAATAEAFGAGAPGRARGMVVDVTQAGAVEAAARAALAEGPIDVLVNNAGQSLFGAFEEVSPDEARALFEVNVFAPWALTRAVLPAMRERGEGIIVQVSSGCGLNGMPGLSAYCASKFALEGFSEALAQEVAGFGIRTMIVEPGAVATRFISHGTREAGSRLEAYGFLSGNGKAALEGYYEAAAASPEEIAAAIVSALEGGEPPLRLLLGGDNRGSVLAKAEQLRALASG